MNVSTGILFFGDAVANDNPKRTSSVVVNASMDGHLLMLTGTYRFHADHLQDPKDDLGRKTKTSEVDFGGIFR